MEKQQPELPSTFEMLANLTDSVKDVLGKYVERGQLLVPEDVARARLSVCFDCDKFVKQPEGAIIPFRCSVCGCGMKVKTRLAAMKCPIDKWGVYNPTDSNK